MESKQYKMNTVMSKMIITCHLVVYIMDKVKISFSVHYLMSSLLLLVLTTQILHYWCYINKMDNTETCNEVLLKIKN